MKNIEQTQKKHKRKPNKIITKEKGDYEYFQIISLVDCKIPHQIKL